MRITALLLFLSLAFAVATPGFAEEMAEETEGAATEATTPPVDSEPPADDAEAADDMEAPEDEGTEEDAEDAG